VQWIEIADIEKQQLAFDHALILRDYIKWRKASEVFWSTKRRNW
jgi:hypothetical protein